jgi:N-acetylneuraminate synthase
MEAIKKTGLPIILGIGGRNVPEIDAKLEYFGEQLSVLMVGFQSFPSQLEDVKLGKIKLLKEKYPNLNIGYADHSSFSNDHAIISNEYAYILGATYFEKHLTLDEGQERLDYQSALGVEKTGQIVERLKYLDEEVFKYNADELVTVEGKELAYRNRQKSVVAARDLKAGEVIDETAIDFKMIDKPNGEVDGQLFIGKTLTEAVEQYDVLTLAQVTA